MVVIRLSRAGDHKRPFYHVVAADRRRARDGKFLERLGYFNPIAKGNATHLQLDVERIQHWVANGAQPSDRVKALVKRFEAHGTGPKPVKKRPAKKAVVAEAKEETPVEEAPAVEATAEKAPVEEKTEKAEAVKAAETKE